MAHDENPLATPARSTSSDTDSRALAQMFADVGKRLSLNGDVHDTMRAVTELTVDVVPGAAWASITQGHDRSFSTLASSSPVALGADQLQYDLGTGPCIDAVISDSVFASNDLALDERWSFFGAQASREYGTRSVLSLRLAVDVDAADNAALNVYGDHRDAFDDSSRFLATVLATHAAIAVAAAVDREHAAQLQGALESNREIGVAMGVLMTRHGVTRAEAFDLLRMASQGANRKLRDIANDVADTGDLDLSSFSARQRRTRGGDQRG